MVSCVKQRSLIHPHLHDVLVNVRPSIALLAWACRLQGRVNANHPHLLRVVDPVDDTYRRQMNRQLTVQESRHKLARDICHGKRGQIMQAYRTGQDRFGGRTSPQADR